MKTLLRHFVSNEFVIDEQPLPVYLSQDEDSADLVELTTKILSENERLQSLNRELQQRSASPADLEKLIRSLLPTLDSFDRVLHLARSYPQSEAMDNWLKSVESIYFRMLTLLESYGLFQLKSVGAKVDLNMHEVVEYRPSAEHPHETIISERQKGYVFRGKLLRDAKVVVAYNERS
jgi:molecular chaperone GrpE